MIRGRMFRQLASDGGRRAVARPASAARRISPPVTTAACFALAALTPACTASSEQVSPPRYDPYFPSAVAVSPDEKLLFILNANSDLRYDSGTFQVYDLEALDRVAAEWLAGSLPAGCVEDPLIPRAALCPTSQGENPAPFVIPGGTAKVGNFGTALAVQPLLEADGSPSNELRLFSPVRGDPSLTWADFDTVARRIDCGESGEFPRCDDAHRLDRYLDDDELPAMPTEPYGLYVDAAGGLAYVTHLTSGFLTLATAPADEGSRPQLVDFLGELFEPNSRGIRASAVAARVPGDPSGLVYVTSTSEARVATAYVAYGKSGADGEARPVLVKGPSFFYDEVVADGNRNDARGIAFSSDGNRAFIVGREPPSVLVYDTSLTPTGMPRNEFLGSLEVCPRPAGLAVAESEVGVRGYLPCFSTGELWIVDLDRLQLVSVAQVGRGPQGVAIAPVRQRVYVANFAEDTIAVVDITPGARLEGHAVLRVGAPRKREEE